MKKPKFKRPSPGASESDVREESEPRAKRKATVYDAVAGRVSQYGLIDHVSGSVYRGQPLRPDEVLFKAPNAPTRYEETDYYFAHTNLPPDQELPSGELLSALHAYISNYYAKSEEPVNPKVWNSMDESALIALGILVEETAREVLGETGDLVFTEAANEEESSDEVRGSAARNKTRSRREAETRDEDDTLDSRLSGTLSPSSSDEAE